MYFLGIDPGIATGYAVVDDDGNLVTSGTLPPTQLGYLNVFRLADDWPDLQVMIEWAPEIHGHLGQELRTINARILNTFPTAKGIVPGVWKTSQVARLTRPERLHTTRHAYDAYRIAMFARERWHNT